MSDRGKCACARAGCHKLVSEDRALWMNGLPYCTHFCFDREHHGHAPEAPAQFVMLQENQP